MMDATPCIESELLGWLEADAVVASRFQGRFYPSFGQVDRGVPFAVYTLEESTPVMTLNQGPLGIVEARVSWDVFDLSRGEARGSATLLAARLRSLPRGPLNGSGHFAESVLVSHGADSTIDPQPGEDLPNLYGSLIECVLRFWENPL